jgi:hypothetical protein
MGFRLPLLALILAALAAAAGPVRAQSLADIAKKEQERRKTIKESGKVYSDKDLKPAPPSATTPASGDAATPADGAKPTSPADAAKDAGAAADASSEQPKDQKYWSERMKGLQTQLDRDLAFAGALQVQINALNTDFVNRDDPAQRAVVANNRQKALDELARLNTAIEDGRKAIADLEDEARRASVPPGWLR